MHRILLMTLKLATLPVAAFLFASGTARADGSKSASAAELLNAIAKADQSCAIAEIEKIGGKVVRVGTGSGLRFVLCFAKYKT